MIDPASLDRDCFYWILGPDGEPEPARWDGDGWALCGGGELDEVEVLSDEPIVFTRQRRVEQEQPAQPADFTSHLRPAS